LKQMICDSFVNRELSDGELSESDNFHCGATCLTRDEGSSCAPKFAGVNNI